MPRRTSTKSSKAGLTPGAGPAEPCPFDATRFENILQVGGIRTGSLDCVPTAAGGGPQSCRVAFVDTGGGLRFTVALDRGGDIVDAAYNQHNLAYLTPNGYRPPSHAYHFAADWLTGWPGGLLTSCGPNYFGPPRTEDGHSLGLHGHHSNTPAAVEMLLNPDPQRGRNEMLLSLVIRDSRMFGPVLEVRRQIQCRLGIPQIVLYDQVTNRGNTRVAHNWLYHVNLGYPLVDAGAKLIYRGRTQYLPVDAKMNDAKLNKLKTVPPPLEEHRGPGERVLIVDNEPDGEGMCHAGLINAKLGLALELVYPSECFPRLVNWQHFGPSSYVTGLEPFSGSLLGKDNDKHPKAAQWLEPGETRRYQMTIKVHEDKAGLRSLAGRDGKLTM
jgi:hypothetical protein